MQYFADHQNHEQLPQLNGLGENELSQRLATPDGAAGVLQEIRALSELLIKRQRADTAKFANLCDDAVASANSLMVQPVRTRTPQICVPFRLKPQPHFPDHLCPPGFRALIGIATCANTVHGWRAISGDASRVGGSHGFHACATMRDGDASDFR